MRVNWKEFLVMWVAFLGVSAVIWCGMALLMYLLMHPPTAGHLIMIVAGAVLVLTGAVSFIVAKD